MNELETKVVDGFEHLKEVFLKDEVAVKTAFEGWLKALHDKLAEKFAPKVVETPPVA